MKSPNSKKAGKLTVKGAAEPAAPSAKQFVEQLKTYASATELKKYHRYFEFDGTDREDVFIGVRMGQVFALAKEFIKMPLDEIEKLLESPIHEARVGAVSIMDFQARSKKTPEVAPQRIIQPLYKAA